MSEKRVTSQYEVEFKLDAVRFVEEQGYTDGNKTAPPQ
jgi:transposase-like protein